PRGGIRLPALRPLSPHDRPRERRLRAAGAAAGGAARAGGHPREGHEPAEAGPARLAGQPPAFRALGWPAPARGPGPRTPGAAPDAPPRRALRLPGRPGPAATAPMAPAPARRPP